MFELLAPAISLTANGLLIWSGFRTWRIKNGFLKWRSGVGVATLLSTVVTAISVLLIVGLFKLHARSAPTVALKISATPEQFPLGSVVPIFRPARLLMMVKGEMSPQ